MKMMDQKMKSICRGVVSSFAGVESETMAAVIAMRMRSAGYGAEAGATMVSTIMEERMKAAQDFVF